MKHDLRCPCPKCTRAWGGGTKPTYNVKGKGTDKNPWTLELEEPPDVDYEHQQLVRQEQALASRELDLTRAEADRRHELALIESGEAQARREVEQEDTRSQRAYVLLKMDVEHHHQMERGVQGQANTMDLKRIDQEEAARKREADESTLLLTQSHEMTLKRMQMTRLMAQDRLVLIGLVFAMLCTTIIACVTAVF